MLAADLASTSGSDRVYQLAGRGDRRGLLHAFPVLFDESATHDELAARLKQGAKVDAVKADSKGNGELGEGAIAMFVLSPATNSTSSRRAMRQSRSRAMS